MIKKKIIRLEEIDNIRSIIRKKRKVLVGGCFDLLHYGHLIFLKKAKQEGNFLIVALEPDEFIKKEKKREPFHTQNQRAEILSSLTIVDLVVLLPYFLSDEDYFNLVKKIKPAVIAITENDPQLINKKKYAAKIGGKIKIVCPLLSNFSTTKIYESIFGD